MVYTGKVLPHCGGAKTRLWQEKWRRLALQTIDVVASLKVAKVSKAPVKVTRVYSTHTFKRIQFELMLNKAT